jgi:hypothetical protein
MFLIVVLEVGSFGFGFGYVFVLFLTYLNIYDVIFLSPFPPLEKVEPNILHHFFEKW